MATPPGDFIFSPVFARGTHGFFFCGFCGALGFIGSFDSIAHVCHSVIPRGSISMGSKRSFSVFRCSLVDFLFEFSLGFKFVDKFRIVTPKGNECPFFKLWWFKFDGLGSSVWCFELI